MNLKLRYFTVDEAEALTKKITDIFMAAQETKRSIEKKVEEWRRVHKNLDVAEEAVIRGQVDFLATRLENQLNEVTEMGCLPKDLDLGLVDFPARINGKEGYLCWKMGEDSIQHWHGITEGYSGRRPIHQQDVVK